MAASVRGRAAYILVAAIASCPLNWIRGAWTAALRALTSPLYLIHEHIGLVDHMR